MPAEQECLTVSAVAKPGDHVLGVLVRREDGVEHSADHAVVDDKGHAFEQRHARDLERRQFDRVRKFESFVGEHREWEVQAVDRFALVASILGR